jgi:hypothetical protein
VETCQRRRCQDNQCTYTPIIGDSGPRCQDPRICCQDAEGNPVCCAAGVPTCGLQDECCVPLTCEDLPGQCGSELSDGCGGSIECGCCAPQVCSGTEQGTCVIRCGNNQCDPDTQKCCTNTGNPQQGPICIPYDQCCTRGQLGLCLPNTNAFNSNNNLPFVERVSGTANSVTLRFVNPTQFLAFYEIRIDGEMLTCGEPHETITGDWEYPGVCVGGPCQPSPQTRTYTADSTVEVRFALGPENDWFFESNLSSWVTFNVGA